ncbi:MAG: hypothetical protein A2Z18_06145 [Armatimonadetes bacterium RBG_16_58_9]|nr:MAG: hypothetical protein A2Z18_06145 [Armatimonadetes bacterium RBG_16_58_9]
MVSPSHTVRILQPGDQWDYIVTGTISDGTQMQVLRVTGTATITMTPETTETTTRTDGLIVTLTYGLTDASYANP